MFSIYEYQVFKKKSRREGDEKVQEDKRWRFEMMFNIDECFNIQHIGCLLYTSDAADDMQCVDLGGRRIIKK